MAAKLLTPASQGSAQSTRRNFFAIFCGLGVSIRSYPLRFCCFSVVVVCLTALWWAGTPHRLFSASNPTLRENEIDAALQTAAASALGEREGTIIVMDPQTGRVRAVVNAKLSFNESFAPGSTIKPFTALAAMRAGLIDKNSRTLCRQHYAHKDFDTVCAHAPDLPPLNTSEAIAYSCNYFFGTLGERLSEASLGETLRSFGFGPQAADGQGHHSSAQLLRGKRDPRNALGEGDYLRSTPMQLIAAYSALVNGGRLFIPRVAPLSDFQSSPPVEISIAPEHRAVILRGMLGAVRYGTAAKAGLKSISLNIFGKTGTSAPVKGFRSQGWFVGFAAPQPFNATSETLPAPANVRVAVLVFLKRAHGADAAAMSRGVFQEYERLLQTQSELETSPGVSRNQDQGATNQIGGANLSDGDSNASARDSRLIRVHLVREGLTTDVTLEEYVAGVVATEGALEDEPEALKALAIAARTYAVKNLGRHAKDGYDFCTTTHCQRFQPQGNQTGATDRAATAVRATAGQILRDDTGQLVDSYFSASCGGMTANIQTLWGAKAPAYLRGVQDESCATMPHHGWTDVISAEQLGRALRSDVRTDPGSSLHELIVTRRDATGRAELIEIDGERHRSVNGWDFKIIVGRKLGWNLLKSSRFEVLRSGSNFIFRGSGFGHGLGLCQEGAHVMAQRGAGFEQILAKYFPGTSVDTLNTSRRLASLIDKNEWPDAGQAEARPLGRAGLETLAETKALANARASAWGQVIPADSNFLGKAIDDANQPRTFADFLWNTGALSATESRIARTLNASAKFITLSSEHFRVSYPAATPQRDAAGILKTLESTREELMRQISSAGLSLDRFPSLEIFVNDSTGNFVGRTGQPWWAAAATRGHRIELQPTAVLQRRGVLTTTLRHELAHVFIESVSHGRAPRWLAEGMALHLAGEGPMISRYAAGAKMTPAEIDAKLLQASSADQMRAAYAAAYGEVRKLAAQGDKKLWQRIATGQ